jgi:4,5:9,10-diseco-3-hydroxy-5,9,17-trioxoandrosta-1(10),2-diene-4-oate hydrolase
MSTSDEAKVVPEGEYVDVGDQLRIHYHAAGEGFPVVFLHGSGPGASGWSNFRRNYPRFAAAGLRAIVPDTLGFGYSSKPEHLDYDMDFVLGGLRRFLDGIGVQRCAVVGNSHGGALAIKLALEDPERVTRLVLMAPGGLEERETYMKMPGIRAMMKTVMGLGPSGAAGGAERSDTNGEITRETLRRVFELQLYDQTLVTDDILDERVSIARLQHKRIMTTLQVPHLSPRLGELRCPIFGLWGMNDQFCPPSGALTLAQNCKQARVMMLTECGHWVMVEKADIFNRLCIDFVKEAA